MRCHKNNFRRYMQRFLKKLIHQSLHMEKSSVVHSAGYVPNGFLMDADNAACILSNQKSVLSQSNSNVANGVDVMSGNSKVVILPKSASETNLLDGDSEPHSEQKIVNQSPPNSLRLAVSTGCLTPVTLGCLSPLTPTSKFHKSILSHEPSSLIIATVLCNWDNIFGPKVRCLWIAEHEMRTKLTLDLLNFVANQTLSGEVMHNLLTPAFELKLYIAAEKGIVLVTLIFGAEGRKDLAVHSLSFIVPHDKLQQFFIWKDVCLEWMNRAVQRIRIELTKNVDKAYESLQSNICTFIRATESAIQAGFPKKIQLIDTILHPHHVFDAEFTRRAITAHLFQCQQSLVIGNSMFHVNLVINTLSLFMNQHRKHRCRLLTDSTSDLYSPDFCLQGLLKDKLLDSTLNEIYYSRYPTALIDVDEEKVWILCVPNEYASRRRKFILKDLNALMNDAPTDEIETLQYSSMFEAMSYDDTIIEGFLKEFHCLPLTHGVRETYVQHFMSSLQRLALVLIQVTEGEIQKNQKNGSVSVNSLIQKLRKSLALNFFCDFMIVLCVAEILKPGIIGCVCGNEQKLDQLIPWNR